MAETRFSLSDHADIDYIILLSSSGREVKLFLYIFESSVKFEGLPRTTAGKRQAAEAARRFPGSPGDLSFHLMLILF